MQLGQALGQQRDIGGADLEKPVATERAAAATLEVLRLGLHDGSKKCVRSVEDPLIGHVHLTTIQMTILFPLW